MKELECKCNRHIHDEACAAPIPMKQLSILRRLDDLVARGGVLCLTTVAFVFAFPLRPAVGAEGNCLAIYSPEPDYPLVPGYPHNHTGMT
jgi:hypothetical protein